MEKITLLVTINFGIQLLVDLPSVKFVDKTGYRAAAVAAHILATVGIAELGVSPDMLPDPYLRLLLCVCLYAVGDGLTEVLVSPIAEACPTEKRGATMSLLRSFYCWGSVLVIAVSTLFFTVLGVGNWRTMALLWAMVSAGNIIFFTSTPVTILTEEGQGMPIKSLLREETFWVLAFIIVCAGASEQTMSQWVFTFAESGLQVSKTVGDMVGPCMLAIPMGALKTFYARFSGEMDPVTLIAGSGVLCILNYILVAFSTNPIPALTGCGLCGLSVGILWPGVFSLASATCSRGGTTMFALLTLADDLGCSTGPTLVGPVSDTADGSISTGLTVAIAFPILLTVVLSRVRGDKVKLEGEGN